MSLSTNEKYELMTRNLQEVMGQELEIKAILDQETFKVYWGTAPTGKIHLGYFVPFLKIADFLDAGCEVTILLADIHAYLDNMKSTLEQLKFRTEYYEVMIKTVLTSLNIDINKLKFVKGSDYQLSSNYTMDVYKINSLTTLSNAKHAGAEVVKQSGNPSMTGLLYPSLQSLDEHYLNVHGEIGGIDQRKIFGYARQYMPKIGYKKSVYFMNEMVPGLRYEKQQEIIQKNYDEEFRNKLEELLKTNTNNLKLKVEELLNTNDTSDFDNKMSSSNENSKIDFLDNPQIIKSKIKRVYCLPGDANDNSLMVILEKILLPLLKRKNMKFIIPRHEKYGGAIEYDNINIIKEDFQNSNLHPGDFKNGIMNSLNDILKPIQDIFNDNTLKTLVSNAYDLKKQKNNKNTKN